MDKTVKARLTDALNNITSFILTGNRDREKAIKKLNEVFQTGFVEVHFPQLCKAEISSGVTKYKNAYSHPTLKTGLRIIIMNDRNLTKDEIISYGRFFGESERFVRSFMVLGFDTLILQPKENFNGKGIKELHISLQSFFKGGQREIK